MSAAGDIGEWRETEPLPVPLLGHTAIVTSGWLWVAGGLDETMTARSEVYGAYIEADGSLGRWMEGASLPEGRFGHAMTHAGTTLVVAGGLSAPRGAPTSAVYSGRICR